MQEIWKDIPEYEGLYQVSSEWDVRSILRCVQMKNWRSKVMPSVRLKKDIKNGYYSVCLSKDNVKKWKRVNRLVYCTFKDVPYKFDNFNNCVCHNDDNPLNDRLDNLFMGTQSDNIIDMHKKWRWVDKKWEKHPLAKLTDIVVIEIKKLIKSWYTNIQIEGILAVPRTSVAHIKNGSIWKHITI